MFQSVLVKPEIRVETSEIKSITNLLRKQRYCAFVKESHEHENSS